MSNITTTHLPGESGAPPEAAIWASRYPRLPDALPRVTETIVARADARPALIDGATGAALSYGQLAARIEAAGAPADVIALQGPNSALWAEIALGALHAGAAVTGIGPGADGARQLALTGARLVAAPPRGPHRRDVPYALLPCSSGTTGLPKAVMLTHANLAAGVAQVRAGMRFTEEDVVLGVAPFAHVMGFVGALVAPLAAGATVVIAAGFDPALIARHGVTVLIGPPPVAQALLATPADLSSLQLVVIGGAPFAPALHRRLAGRLPHAAIGQGYGMTETTLAIPIPDRETGTPPGTAGRLAPSTRLRVHDGELLVRGPQVTPGYLGDPEATAELIDADGWLHTGDTGLVDDDGYVHVTDRLKELIKVNALQVAPAELEALLLAHPQVADAAVVGRPDERTGEVPVAVVVPRGELDPQALTAWVAERVARHKRLAAVVIAERLPRTPSGKLLRRELVAR